MQNKYTIKMFQRALRDLDSIYQYIYEQVPEYAEEQADRLEAGILVWKNFIVVICSNRIFITEYEKSLLNRGYHDKLLLNYNILKVYVESRK